MPVITVRLLGPPRIERDGRPVSVDTRKALALLAYLALSQRPVTRAEAAALLWPESEHERARAALRRTLSSLTTALGGMGLVVEGDTLALDAGALDLDVEEFRRLASEGDAGSLREAVGVYRGDFLAGFGLRDSPDFDGWQLGTSEALRRELGSVLERLVEALERDDVDGAIAYARRWVELDPLHEPAHRALMRLHARKGDRAAAARQYKECVSLLERELGVSPDPETTRLYESAHAGDAPAAPAEAARLYELMGDLLTLQGRYREAERRYESSLGMGASRWSVRRKQADLAQRLGDFEGAEGLYAEAVGALDPSQTGERARITADRSLNAHRRGDAKGAEEHARQSLADAEAAGDDRALAQAHNIAGVLASHRGDAVEARTHLEASLALATEQNDPVATVAALNNLALALKGADIEGALRLAQRALDLCARVGDRHREAALHSNLADLLRVAGRNEEARAHVRTSAAIFAEVGRPDELSSDTWAEIWKLVEW